MSSVARSDSYQFYLPILLLSFSIPIYAASILLFFLRRAIFPISGRGETSSLFIALILSLGSSSLLLNLWLFPSTHSCSTRSFLLFATFLPLLLLYLFRGLILLFNFKCSQALQFFKLKQQAYLAWQNKAFVQKGPAEEVRVEIRPQPPLPLTEGINPFYVKNRHRLHSTKHLVGLYCAALAVLSCFWPFALLFGGENELSLSAGPCTMRQSKNIVILIEILALLALCLLLNWKLIPFNDAWRIKNELFFCNLIMMVMLIIVVCLQRYSYYYLQELVIISSLFAMFFLSIMHPIYKTYQFQRRQAELHCNSLASANDLQGFLGSKVRKLVDFLGLEGSFESLLSFTQTEFSSENLLFYGDAVAFKLLCEPLRKLLKRVPRLSNAVISSKGNNFLSEKKGNGLRNLQPGEILSVLNSVEKFRNQENLAVSSADNSVAASSSAQGEDSDSGPENEGNIEMLSRMKTSKNVNLPLPELHSNNNSKGLLFVTPRRGSVANLMSNSLINNSNQSASNNNSCSIVNSCVEAAFSIYSEYLAELAPSQLNVADDIMSNIREKMALLHQKLAESKNNSADNAENPGSGGIRLEALAQLDFDLCDVFDAAVDSIVTLIEADSFQRYLTSKFYRNFKSNYQRNTAKLTMNLELLGSQKWNKKSATILPMNLPKLSIDLASSEIQHNNYTNPSTATNNQLLSRHFAILNSSPVAAESQVNTQKSSDHHFDFPPKSNLSSPKSPKNVAAGSNGSNATSNKPSRVSSGRNSLDYHAEAEFELNKIISAQTNAQILYSPQTSPKVGNPAALLGVNTGKHQRSASMRLNFLAIKNNFISPGSKSASRGPSPAHSRSGSYAYGLRGNNNNTNNASNEGNSTVTTVSNLNTCNDKD
jgi:hypothetical protein